MKREFISKKEIGFWIVIIAMFVTGATKFTQLQGQVNALDASTMTKGANMREDITALTDKIDLLIESNIELKLEVVEMRKDIEYYLGSG